ncbi:glycoside hydrolase family 97 protein [Pseudoflavitalea sp. G-6-1-2]|nr:glycoside hydrolase family 97 protein [Pseudoflavitalea sp. G-6-1-2]
MLPVAACFCCMQPLAAQEYRLSSPDKKTELRISVTDSIRYSVFRNGTQLVNSSVVHLVTSADNAGGFKVKKAVSSKTDQWLQPVVQQKNSRIRDQFNAMSLAFKNKLELQWRAYDNGIAWRWVTAIQNPYTVNEEKVTISLSSGSKSWYPVEEGFMSHNERLYQQLPVDSISGKHSLASLPALFETNGVKLMVTESDLLDYAGMWLQSSGNGVLQGTFPHYPTRVELTSDRDEPVRERASFLAKKTAPATLPWRLIMIAENDKDLLTNQLVYQLATPSTGDFSWVKPGKAIWDWWNDNNIYGVDFRAGINTATYKYYIDFAAKNGVEYVVFDEGWCPTRDLLHPKPEMDMDELSSYAASKNVGLILWVNWYALDKQMDEALALFAKWKVRGIKVDFMQRDDQPMVNFYERTAKAAAAHHMMVDFHGAYKPTGIYRTYPNVMSFEGVYGMEQSKWDPQKLIGPDHNVTFPFIRMAAGPADYTPGAMLNAQRDDWAPIWSNPMSLGTRCHQLAMYVVFESPLQMLADNPTHYYKEPECMEFLKSVPAVWDSTIAVSGKVGEHILTARKALNGDWYIGAMSNWTARELPLDLSFLPEGKYKMQIWKDGINADRNAQDFKMETISVTKQSRLMLKLAPGGGFVARLTAE